MITPPKHCLPGIRSFSLRASSGDLTMRITNGRLAVSGLLAEDPYSQSNTSSALNGVAFRGGNATLFDFCSMFSKAARAMHYKVRTTPSPLITYAYDDGDRISTFVVPERWKCSKPPIGIPCLLDMQQHLERVFGLGFDSVESLIGEEAARCLVQLVTLNTDYGVCDLIVLEYASHSFSHSIGVSRELDFSDWMSRAKEEVRADRIASKLISMCFGEKVALAVMATQVLMRITCDLRSPEYDLEALAHKRAAEIVFRECCENIASGTDLLSKLNDVLTVRLNE